MEQDTPRLGRNTRPLKGSTDNKERNARFNTSFCQFTVLQSGLSRKTNTALVIQRWRYSAGAALAARDPSGMPLACLMTMAMRGPSPM